MPGTVRRISFRGHFEGRWQTADDGQRRALALFARAVRPKAGGLSLHDSDVPWDEVHVAAFGTRPESDVPAIIRWWGINQLEWRSRAGHRYYQYAWRRYDTARLLQWARDWRPFPDPQAWVHELVGPAFERGRVRGG
ncbi:MAG: hypothetical protein AB1609_13035 [Bacillota bacterium]